MFSHWPFFSAKPSLQSQVKLPTVFTQFEFGLESHAVTTVFRVGEEEERTIDVSEGDFTVKSSGILAYFFGGISSIDEK